jgi:hypothetical protein
MAGLGYSTISFSVYLPFPFRLAMCASGDTGAPRAGQSCRSSRAYVTSPFRVGGFTCAVLLAPTLLHLSFGEAGRGLLLHQNLLTPPPFLRHHIHKIHPVWYPQLQRDIFICCSSYLFYFLPQNIGYCYLHRYIYT